MVASRQLLLPPQKKHSEHTTHKAKRGELNGLVVHVDVRIGLALYGSSCGPRCELSLFSEEIKNPLKKKVSHKKRSFAKTAYKGVTRGQRELARKGRPRSRSQLRVPICGGMSTADAHGA
jgi:hypothetical protein